MFNHCEKSLFKQWKPTTMLISATELTELIYDNEEIKNNFIKVNCKFKKDLYF